MIMLRDMEGFGKRKGLADVDVADDDVWCINVMELGFFFGTTEKNERTDDGWIQKEKLLPRINASPALYFSHDSLVFDTLRGPSISRQVMSPAWSEAVCGVLLAMEEKRYGV